MKAVVTLDDGTTIEAEIDQTQLDAIIPLVTVLKSCEHEYPDPWPTKEPPDCTRCGSNFASNQTE